MTAHWRKQVSDSLNNLLKRLSTKRRATAPHATYITANQNVAVNRSAHDQRFGPKAGILGYGRAGKNAFKEAKVDVCGRHGNDGWVLTLCGLWRRILVLRDRVTATTPSQNRSMALL